MNKPVFILLFTFFAFHICRAQENLVPNGSFEEYWECPANTTELNVCKYWYRPTSSTADYFNTCQTDISTGVSIPITFFGWQFPFDGNAFAGLIVYEDEYVQASEYLQVKLKSPLAPCQNYVVSFYAVLANHSSRASNVLGARFDKTPITSSPPFEYNGFELPPNLSSNEIIIDTLVWTKISGIYAAKGGEEYLTIGRFIDTNYFSNSNIPHIQVLCSPCQQSENAAYYFIDNVSVSETETKTNFDLPNTFTPNGNLINDYWYPQHVCIQDWKCEIINRWGESIYIFDYNDNGWDGTGKTGRELTDGVYYYRIYNSDQQETGFIQLIR